MTDDFQPSAKSSHFYRLENLRIAYPFLSYPINSDYFDHFLGVLFDVWGVSTLYNVKLFQEM